MSCLNEEHSVRLRSVRGKRFSEQCRDTAGQRVCACVSESRAENREVHRERVCQSRAEQCRESVSEQSREQSSAESVSEQCRAERESVCVCE